MGSKMYNHYGNWQGSVGVYCLQWTTAKLQFLLVNKTRNEIFSLADAEVELSKMKNVEGT